MTDQGAARQKQVDDAWNAYVQALRAADAHAAREAHASRSRQSYAAWKREAATLATKCERLLSAWNNL